MKMRLLTALVAAGCFSQMAQADGTLTTGSITNQTTATATVTINQPVTLENTLTPESGLKAGQDIDGAAILAKGNLKIKESGVTARLAIKMAEDENTSLTTYAEGHENEDEYKLTYVAGPTSPAIEKSKVFLTSDGVYDVTDDDVSSMDYMVITNTNKKMPKAGNYVISITGAVYNP